jgi:hypothetical protein
MLRTTHATARPRREMSRQPNLETSRSRAYPRRHTGGLLRIHASRRCRLTRLGVPLTDEIHAAIGLKGRDAMPQSSPTPPTSTPMRRPRLAKAARSMTPST